MYPAYTSGRSAAGRAAAACFDPVTRSGGEARGTDAAELPRDVGRKCSPVPSGQSVPVSSAERADYGVFIALTPNLCGLAERDDTLEPGQPVCVYIKAIHPRDAQLKLTVLHRLDALPPQPLQFTKDQGRLDVWRYGKPGARKKRDGVLTFGCGKSVSISLFQRRTDGPSSPTGAYEFAAIFCITAACRQTRLIKKK